jgi:hypothetical protein
MLLESDPATTSFPSSELATDSIRPVVNCCEDPKSMLDRVGLTSRMTATLGSFETRL